MKLKAVFLGVALACMACATPAAAWTQLGVREVRDRTDRDVIVEPGDVWLIAGEDDQLRKAGS